MTIERLSELVKNYLLVLEVLSQVGFDVHLETQALH